MTHLAQGQDFLDAQVTQHSLIIIELLQGEVERWLFLRSTLDRITEVLTITGLDLFYREGF